MLKKKDVPRPLKKGDKVTSTDDFSMDTGIIIWVDDNLVRIKTTFGGEILVDRNTVTHRG